MERIIEFLPIICAFFVLIIIVFLILFSIMKRFDKYIKSKNIFMATILLILAFLFITYLGAMVIKTFVSNSYKVGSADAWIGFAGSVLGSSLTMLALFFTLKHNEEIHKASQTRQIKPYISCDITNYDANKREIMIENCINNYGFIDFKMRNVSGNIANEIKSTEEYSMIENERISDLLERYGISIHTVALDESIFLAPNDEYYWRTNIAIETDESGEYIFGDSDFCFKHVIVFEFTDSAGLQRYKLRFEYEININVDVNDNLHFFKHSAGNYIEQVNE